MPTAVKPLDPESEAGRACAAELTATLADILSAIETRERQAATATQPVRVRRNTTKAA